MSTIIRLARHGRKHNPVYRLTVQDSRKTPTGKFLQQIGFYDPNPETPSVKIDEASAIEWLKKGVTLSPSVKDLFNRYGITYKYEQVKKGIPLDQIEAKVKEWKVESKSLSKKALAKKKAEAEAKAAEATAEKAEG